MKAFKWIWASLMILCLLCPAFSLAEAGEPRFCLPEEVDLSQVQEIDGRLKSFFRPARGTAVPIVCWWTAPFRRAFRPSSRFAFRWSIRRSKSSR